jgi:hypothetical protein
MKITRLYAGSNVYQLTIEKLPAPLISLIDPKEATECAMTMIETAQELLDSANQHDAANACHLCLKKIMMMYLGK